MLFAAITAITFTSCDKDDMISYDLKGTWKGDMYQVSEYGGKRYNASYTELYFETSAFRTARGIGKWIDHYSNNPYYDYFASNIDWQVKDQIIYITFKNGDRTTLEIRNYDIDRDRFSQGNIYEDSLWQVWNERFQEFRDRSWARSGSCAGCRQWRNCLGNGMHNWHGSSSEVLQCHYAKTVSAASR